MRIRLLTTGGFIGLRGVSLPVVVEGTQVYNGDGYTVDFDIIAALPGFVFSDEDTEYGTKYTFFTGTECEVVE